MLIQEEELVLDKKELRVLSSDTRMQILKLLANRNYTVSELAKKLNYSKSTIHEHINKLLEAGLIERVDSGFANKWVYYKLSKKGSQLFDRTRKVVVIVASVFLLLGTLQLALLASNFFVVSSMRKAAPEIASKHMPLAEKHAHERQVESREVYAVPTIQKSMLLYGSIASFVIAALLILYYKRAYHKIVLRRTYR